MRLDIQIKEAFTGRTMPSHAINPQLDTSFLGPDETDAFWFQGRDWRELTRDDWQRHYCGIFFFTADALAYYLPSIMLHSMGRQSDVFLAADSLVLFLKEERLLQRNANTIHVIVWRCQVRSVVL
jgi:hypothetical protein